MKTEEKMTKKDPTPETKPRMKRGRLSKKEETEMKKKHKSISAWLAPPTPIEIVRHEEVVRNEVEIFDEAREERLERMRRKILGWKAVQECRRLVNDIIDEAVDESNASLCRGIVEGYMMDVS